MTGRGLSMLDVPITQSDVEALMGTGIGVFVGNPGDPVVAGRPTAADFILTSIQEVERFLRTLAR
jgi:trehalose 6-phosphate phosphatase